MPDRKDSGSVFIHSLFRTGSTYIWNKFRRRPEFVCYYEPFHHVLATVTPASLTRALIEDSVAAGHPPLDKPYLAEYADLLKESEPGVRHFRKEFSYDDFCLAADAPGRDQKRYVDLLIGHAGDKVPVLQFNRTALRTAWFKARYPDSMNVYIVRDPRDQWQSYHAIRDRLGYDGFFLMDLMALGKNRDHPLIRPLTAIVPLLNVRAESFTETEAAYRLLHQCFEDEEAYAVFYYLWLISLLTNARAADLFIDINALSKPGGYRRRMEACFRRTWGKGLDFSDCRVAEYGRHVLSAKNMADVEGRVRDLVARTFSGGIVRENLEGMSPRLKDLLEEQHRLELARPRLNLSGSLLSLLVQEERVLEGLRTSLKEKDERIAEGEAAIEALRTSQKEKDERIAELEATIEALRTSLREKDERIAEREATIEALRTSQREKDERIAEREATIEALREDLRIMRRSYAYRIGRAALFPWRTAKSAGARILGARSLPGAGRTAVGPGPALSAAERKISVKDQMPLDFGRHRSGLKYGLRHLQALHHPRGVWLDAFIERTFCWGPERPDSFEKPWVGFIHVPPGMPPWYHPDQANATIFRSAAWRKSLPLCRGLFTFSEYHRRHLRAELDVPVDALLLPSETPALTWSPEALESNPRKMVVQVGWWLRNLHGIYRLPATEYEKVFLDAGHQDIPRIIEKERQILAAEGALRTGIYDSVRTVPFLSSGEYDAVLSRNVAFLHLYDVSASNAIVECIVRSTPLLINPLEAAVEYLGESYPFYFRSLEEAAAKLMDKDLVLRAHEYLKRLPIRERLSGEGFLSAFKETSVYRALPSPEGA